MIFLRTEYIMQLLAFEGRIEKYRKNRIASITLTTLIPVIIPKYCV